MERRPDAALRKVKVKCHVHRADVHRGNRAVPQEVHDFQPDTPLTVHWKVFLQCLKSASRGASSHEFGAGQRPCRSHEGIDEPD